MEYIYWVQEWAKIRQDEVVRHPSDFIIHNCFLTQISYDEFLSAFREIWEMYIHIYGDIAEYPEAFGMPLYKLEEFDYNTTQARDSRSAPYRMFSLLFNLLISGEIINGELIIDSILFNSKHKIKNSTILLERLDDYRFYFEGLTDYKFNKQYVILRFPENEKVLKVLKLMADKANRANRLIDFYCCHYKLLQADWNTINFGNGPDIVADKMHTLIEKEMIHELDAILKKSGYFAKEKSWNEGPGYAYYDKESVMKSNGPYHYWLLSWKTKLVLYLRIRNAANCIDYLKKCPISVKQIFLESDTGCKNRINGTCKFGQEYTIDNKTYWKCGCCSAPFHFSPRKEDIPYYIKLVELGLKKC